MSNADCYFFVDCILKEVRISMYLDVLDVLVSLLGAYSAVLVRLVFMKRGQTWTTNQPSADAMSTIPLDLAETDWKHDTPSKTKT